ncbi:hypothetical protein BDV12DRAFT_203144 [Aspergillus spectabilis]
MADDKTLSETVIEIDKMLEKWEATKPFAIELTSLVDEYSQVIDGFGKVFAVISVVWNIYLSMEKVKENAVQQQAMVDRITKAATVMLTRPQGEITHHIDQQENSDNVSAGRAVQRSFYHDIVPFANTYPITGYDVVKLDNLIWEARRVIVKMQDLIKARSMDGNGATILIL